MLDKYKRISNISSFTQDSFISSFGSSSALKSHKVKQVFLKLVWSPPFSSSNSLTEAVDVVYLDFSKAIDTVSHSIFLEKSAAYGLAGCTLHEVENRLDG